MDLSTPLDDLKAEEEIWEVDEKLSPAENALAMALASLAMNSKIDDLIIEEASLELPEAQRAEFITLANGIKATRQAAATSADPSDEDIS